MLEAFRVGRIYTKTREKETLLQIHQILEDNCIMVLKKYKNDK